MILGVSSDSTVTLKISSDVSKTANAPTSTEMKFNNPVCLSVSNYMNKVTSIILSLCALKNS